MIINNNNNNGGYDGDDGRVYGSGQDVTVGKPSLSIEEMLKANGKRSRSDFVRLIMATGWSGFHWCHVGRGFLCVIQMLALIIAVYGIFNLIHIYLLGAHKCEYVFLLCRFNHALLISSIFVIPYLIMLIFAYGYGIHWLFESDEKFKEKFENDNK